VRVKIASPVPAHLDAGHLPLTGKSAAVHRVGERDKAHEGKGNQSDEQNDARPRHKRSLWGDGVPGGRPISLVHSSARKSEDAARSDKAEFVNRAH